MKQFEGKVALVTGSSNGIGRGIAVDFVKRGAKVTITGRSEDDLQETKRKCLSAGAKDSDILALVGDLGDEKFMESLINQTLAIFGQLDFLVNNAGITDRDRSGKKPGFFTQDLDSYDYIFKINLRCVVYLCRQASPHLEKTKGAIVNISSIASSEIQSCSLAFYSMSKAALDQMTRNLALDLIKKGVRVNCIKPGAVKSMIGSRQGHDQTGQEESLKDFKMIPTGFVAEPEDVAHLAAFLCDNVQSRYIIGQCIRLDGGSSLVSPILSGV